MRRFVASILGLMAAAVIASGQLVRVEMPKVYVQSPAVRVPSGVLYYGAYGVEGYVTETVSPIHGRTYHPRHVKIKKKACRNGLGPRFHKSGKAYRHHRKEMHRHYEKAYRHHDKGHGHHHDDD